MNQRQKQAAKAWAVTNGRGKLIVVFHDWDV